MKGYMPVQLQVEQFKVSDFRLSQDYFRLFGVISGFAKNGKVNHTWLNAFLGYGFRLDISG